MGFCLKINILQNKPKDKMLPNWRDIKWDSSNKISWTAIPKDSIYLDNIRTIRFLRMIEGAV